jgi:acetyltransferase-like isoleucine patch superfamily enzyme
MLGSLKLKLLALPGVFWRARLRIRGAQVAGNVDIIGAPHIRIERGATLVMSDGVRLFSSRHMNPLAGNSPCILWLVTPQAQIELGRDVGGSGITLCAAKRIEIGEGTILGACAMVIDTDFHLPAPGWKWGDNAAETARPVKIGRGCFIGARAIILKGVTIGDGAVIGAGAVVSSDVPPGHLATGNPATIRPLSERWRREVLIYPEATQGVPEKH